MKNIFKKKTAKKVQVQEFLKMDYQEILAMEIGESEHIFDEMRKQVAEVREEITNMRGE